MTDPTPLLRVRSLRVDYRRPGGWRPAVRGVDLELAAGETLAIVGESGSGKSTLARALTRTLPASARSSAEQLTYAGRDLTTVDDREMRALRGREIGFVPQDPMVSLNPVRRIGDQVAETLLIHRMTDRSTARRRAVEQLERVGLPDPERRARQYPHELSGGARQRVLIAIALVAEPRLLICDEPTSALDVSVQRQILDQIDALVQSYGIAVLLVTHDLAVAAERADRIAVMSSGELVEQGDTTGLLARPKQAYTRRLLTSAAVPAPDRASRPAPGHSDLGRSEPEEPDVVLLRVRGLRKTYRALPAVDGIDLAVPRGSTLGLVGESGSGKTTTARLITGLERPTAGSIGFDGIEIGDLRGRELRRLRGRIQLVQQNPYGSLDPRFTIAQSLAEALRARRLGRAERLAAVEDMIERVGLPTDVLERRPSALSGGQRQRVVLARAIATRPDLVVCDEPVSALDAETSAQILRLLAELQDELGLTYLFITHDLAVARRFCHRVAVMLHGRIVEAGPTKDVFDAPQDPYTRRLLESLPSELPLPEP